MSYQVQQALGGAATSATDTLTKYLEQLKNAGVQALNIAADPYLPEMICKVSQLHAIEVGQAVPTCPKTPPGKIGGVGMRNLMPVVRGYVYAQQHPPVKVLAIAGVLGVPFLLGYLLGRR